MEWFTPFIPGALAMLASRAMSRDRNDTGADDAAGRLLLEISPLVPGMISGSVNDSLADKVFLGVYRTAQGYLRQRGKLPTE